MLLDFTGPLQDLTENFSAKVTEPGRPTEAGWFEGRTLARISQRGNHLRVFKPGHILEDTDWNSGSVKTYADKLNPRVEIQTKKAVLPKDIALKLTLNFVGPKPGFNAVVLQAMHREIDGKTPLPVLHLIIRDGKLYIRTAGIVSGRRGSFEQREVLPLVAGQAYHIEIRCMFASRNGWYDVYNNGQLKLSRRGYASASSDPQNLKFSFGVYGPGGKDAELLIEKVGYELLKTVVPPKVQTTPVIISPETKDDDCCKCCYNSDDEKYKEQFFEDNPLHADDGRTFPEDGQ